MVSMSGHWGEKPTPALSDGATVRSSGPPSVPWETGVRPPEGANVLTIILIVLVVLLLFGGGGYFYRGRG